jgi:hypothetical protein
VKAAPEVHDSSGGTLVYSLSVEYIHSYVKRFMWIFLTFFKNIPKREHGSKGIYAERIGGGAGDTRTYRTYANKPGRYRAFVPLSDIPP